MSVVLEPLCLCNTHQLSLSISLCSAKIHRTNPKPTTTSPEPPLSRRVVESLGHKQEGPSMGASSSIQRTKRNLSTHTRRSSPLQLSTHPPGHQSINFSPAQGVYSILSKYQKFIRVSWFKIQQTYDHTQNLKKFHRSWSFQWSQTWEKQIIASQYFFSPH